MQFIHPIDSIPTKKQINLPKALDEYMYSHRTRRFVNKITNGPIMMQTTRNKYDYCFLARDTTFPKLIKSTYLENTPKMS
jgi:hypothetical protein